MAFQLADLVTAGVIFHSRPFCVHGQLQLRGSEMPVLVELTGNPCEDLRGRSFEFEMPENDRPPTDEDLQRVKRFHNQQIGAVGEMTTVPRPRPSLSEEAELDAPAPPSESATGEPQPYIYLEWFSQNGQVILELRNPTMQFIETPGRLRLSDDFDAKAVGLMEEVSLDDSVEDDEESSADSEWDPEDDFPEEPADSLRDDDEEGYGLIPRELDRELEKSAHRVDHEITGGSGEDSEELRELKMMDDLIERGTGTPVSNFLEKLRLPKPDAVQTEPQATQALKAALIELALFGVALDICEHCNATESYRILIDEICPESTVFSQMRGTGWVQHFTTSDYCKLCRPELG